MAGEKDAPTSTTPASPPVTSGSVGKLKDKYQSLEDEENPENKENRVKMVDYKHPAGPKHGGLYRENKGDDGQPLLEKIDPKHGRGYLHRLAYKRFLALNDAWISAPENTIKKPIIIASGWRPNSFLVDGKPNLNEYHRYCRDIKDKTKKPAPRWLDPRGTSGDYTFGCGPVPDGASINCKNGPVDGKLPKEWKDQCNVWRAFISPHETGLAIDFGNYGLRPDSSTVSRQKKERFYIWLTENAHRFGATPYARETWHWEFKIPYEAWKSGEEFVTGGGDDPYNVRIRSTGTPISVKKSKRTGSGKPPCPPKELLSDAEVMEPQVIPLAQPGIKFQKLALRKITDIKSIIIHETLGRFDMVEGPEGVPGKKSPAAIEAMLKDGSKSTHFTISRTGEIRQHAGLMEIAKHTGDSTLDKHSIGIHLINNPLPDKEYAKELVNSSTNHSIIEVGSLFDKKHKHKYFLFNTPSQLEALRALILKIPEGGFPNLKIEFPCSENFVFGVDDRHIDSSPSKQPQGIFCRRRTGDEHFTGLFAEWYLAAAALNPPEAGRTSGAGSSSSPVFAAASAAVAAARGSAEGVSGGVNSLWEEGFLAFRDKSQGELSALKDFSPKSAPNFPDTVGRTAQVKESIKQAYDKIKEP